MVYIGNKKKEVVLMEAEKMQELRGVEGTINKLYAESLDNLEREKHQDGRFTIIMSELDVRRLDYMATILNRKRVALARELLVAALNDAEKLLKYGGWESLDYEELPSTKEDSKSATAKQVYAAIVKGKLPFSLDAIETQSFIRGYDHDED